jgi:Reversibly glycosylated polypeptide
MKIALVVAWYNPMQIHAFKQAWNIEKVVPDFVFFQQGTTKAGCAQTKNAGIKRALDDGADIVVVLDDDCYPVMEQPGVQSLDDLVAAHVAALRPQKVRAVYPTCHPRPRGMPYRNEHIVRPVAASIGLWTNNLDLDAASTLVLGEGAQLEQYARFPFYHHFFPFCGMNFAFRKEWADCAVFIEVPRFYDIWMGWIWEKVAYEKGYCFNLAGPMIEHACQSDVWANLEAEVKNLRINEDLWSVAYNAPANLTATELRALLFSRTLPSSETALSIQEPDPAEAASADLA